MSCNHHVCLVAIPSPSRSPVFTNSMKTRHRQHVTFQSRFQPRYESCENSWRHEQITKHHAQKFAIYFEPNHFQSSCFTNTSSHVTASQHHFFKSHKSKTNSQISNHPRHQRRVLTSSLEIGAASFRRPIRISNLLDTSAKYLDTKQYFSHNTIFQSLGRRIHVNPTKLQKKTWKHDEFQKILQFK